MKRVRTYVRSAADDSGKTKLDILMDSLKDDFDYVMSGLDKLARDGGESENSGTTIAQDLSDTLQGVIQRIAGIQGGNQ